MIKLARRFLIVLNMFLIAGTLLATVSPYIHPDIAGLPAFFGLVFPFLLLCNLFFILFWLSFKKQYALLSLICLVISYPRARKVIQYHFNQDQEEMISNRGEVLSVASYNIRNLTTLFKPGKTSIPKEDFARFIQALQEPHSPDVLCIQEGNHVIPEIAEALRMPHLYNIPGSRTYIISKFPVFNTGKLAFEEAGSLCGWVDLEHPEGLIRIYNLHLKSNEITDKTERMLEEGDIRARQTWLDVTTILLRYGKTTRSRARQAEQIAQHIRSSPYPVIVCGDFNDVPQSYAYEHIQEGLRDSFIENGRGLGITFAGRIPWLRIDYILASPHFELLTHQVKQVPFSDHYPVFARMRIH